MGLLSRLFGRKTQKVNVVDPVDASKGIYTFNRDTTIKYRCARTAPAELRNELIAICTANSCVLACYLLDGLEEPTGAIKLFVSLHLEDPERDLDRIGRMMQACFRKYPDQCNHYFIGADIFENISPQCAIYRRPSGG